MKLKAFIKKVIFEYNPIVARRCASMRRQLTNETPSLLAPNCMGGILFHDLGLRFYSPTVNLMMLQTDFIRMVCNLEKYLAQDLIFFTHPEYNFPCAMLGDVTIHFTHYHTEDEAQNKWQERCMRLNPENMFIFAMERDGLSEADIRALGKVKARGIVVFTAHEYPDIPYTCYVPKLSNDGIVEDILARSCRDGHRKYEEVFDFVKWFNEANGGSYDVCDFCKG